MTLRLSVVGALVLLALSCTQGQPGPEASSKETHHRGDTAREAAAAQMPSTILVRPDQVNWKDGPPSLPSGARFAVLEGDPARDGFFVMRVMLPDGYRIPPHSHPNVERITILSGTFRLGMGERFDQGNAQTLPAGTYAAMPPGMKHFAWAEGPTVVQIGTHGPWAINYVNPSDDPRQQKR